MTAEEEVEVLKATIREAHEVIKDLRTEIKFAKATQADLMKHLTEVWANGVDAVVKEGLASYQSMILQAIREATTSVYARFDQIADVLLGEDAKTKRRGEQSLVDLAREIKRRTQ